MMWKRVDFPEPDGPTMARNSPACTCRSTPRSAWHIDFADAVDLAQVLRLDDGQPLLIGQGLDGIVPGGAQARVERAQSPRRPA